VAKSSKPADYGLEAGVVFLGKYRIDAILGHGGMGVVAMATHLQLEERVAIKFLRDDVILDDETRARFLREAQNAVKLKGEHVARVTDVGTLESGVPYMVMEYLEGIDLGQMLDDSGKVNPNLAVDLLLQACSALAEAHSLGIVHRDIKPGNLFVTWRADGSPLLKILDFGISKAPVGGDMNLTQTQSLLGTPAYMSPEQMRSARTVDPRSDIWSLGTVLHEIIEGSRPFEAESFSEMCVKVAVDPPEALTAVHPPGLEKVILRALEKKAEDRYQTIAEMARDLVPFARDRNSALVAVERMTRMLGRARAAYERSEASSPEAVPRGMMRDVASAPVVAPRHLDDTPGPTPTPSPRGKRGRGGRPDPVELAIGDSTDRIDDDATAITSIEDGTRTTLTAIEGARDGDTDPRRALADAAALADTAAHPTIEGVAWGEEGWTPRSTEAQAGATDPSVTALPDSIDDDDDDARIAADRRQAAANAAAIQRAQAAAQDLAARKGRAQPAPPGNARSRSSPAMAAYAREKSSPAIPALADRDSAPVIAPRTGSGPNLGSMVQVAQGNSTGNAVQGPGVTLPGLFPAAIPGARPTHQRTLTPITGSPVGSPPSPTMASTSRDAASRTSRVVARPTQPVGLAPSRGKWLVLLLALGIGAAVAVFLAMQEGPSSSTASPPSDGTGVQIAPIEPTEPADDNPAKAAIPSPPTAGSSAAGATVTHTAGAVHPAAPHTIAPANTADPVTDIPAAVGTSASDGTDPTRGAGAVKPSRHAKGAGKDRVDAKVGPKSGARPTAGAGSGSATPTKPTPPDPFTIRDPVKH